MDIVSLFSGVGGLDRGFKDAGFNTVWANEFDSNIWESFEANFPETHLSRESITNVLSNEIPDCDGVIGGPPCQSWSAAGRSKGFSDNRGQLFFDFIRIIEEKKPKFFLAENVKGMLAVQHKKSLKHIKKMFVDCGYELSFKLVNSADYGVPQDRARVFFIGIRKDLGFTFKFPDMIRDKVTIRDTIFDLKSNAMPALNGQQHTNGKRCKVPNHEYAIGGFSSMYMSRNRVRAWDEQSFTIQAGGRHAPIHPQAPKMTSIGKDKMEFKKGFEKKYRRLSVREAARLQTFPDSHVFIYKNIMNGYKMVGNAVPCTLANALAVEIKKQLEDNS